MKGSYFRSYKIAKRLAKKYIDWTDFNIDFDFDKNEYYFETGEASRFYYSEKEFLENLENLKKRK